MVVCFWLLLVTSAFAAMSTSNWTVIKSPTNPGNYKRHPPPVEFGPRYLPPTKETYQILLLLRTAGVLCLIYQAICLCYYTIGCHVLPQFNRLDDEEEQFINSQGVSETTKREDTSDEHSIVEKSVNEINAEEPKNPEMAAEGELPLANTQIESVKMEIKKNERVQSQKYPRAKKGHQKELLELIENVMLEGCETDYEVDKTRLDTEQKPDEEPSHMNNKDSLDTARTQVTSKTELHTAEKS